MKLHFEDNLDYQQAAIESTVALFRGQDINRTEFTVSKLTHPAERIAGAIDGALKNHFL
jgi:restriction endonuclease